MIFKQDNIISSEYILYVLGITFILLLATYLILFFFKKKIVSKFELNSGINRKLEVQKLSSKTTLYVYDKIDYDVIIVESDQKFLLCMFLNALKIKSQMMSRVLMYNQSLSKVLIALLCSFLSISCLAQETSKQVDIANLMNPTSTFVSLTLLSFIPLAMIATTTFIRNVIVLSIMRQALGLQQTPPNIVLILLSFF